MTKESFINVLSSLSSAFEFFSYIEDDAEYPLAYDLVIRFGNSDQCAGFYLLFHHLSSNVCFHIIDSTKLGFIFMDNVPVIVNNSTIPFLK